MARPSSSRSQVQDPVILRIDGVDWTYWKSVEITRQMDAIAGSFTIALTDKWVNGSSALPIAAGMACEVLIGNDPVIKGYIDKSAPSFSAQDHGITISGRDTSADLVDASAVHSPGHWQNLNVLELCSLLAAPFGVPVRAEGDMGAPLPSFKLEQGETAFEAMDRALKLRELLACPDGQGGLVLLKAGALSNGIALVQGENILAASASFDMTDRFSAYLVHGQQPGNDDVFGEAAAAVFAETTDPSITRYRPHIIRAESRVDTETARQRAAWECSVRAARSVTVTVTVQGFRQSGPFSNQSGNSGNSGQLWQMNAMTRVDIPYLYIQQDLVASQVTFKRDASSGTTTTIELKDPGAFQPEPKAPSAGKGQPANSPSAPIEAEKDLQALFADNAASEHSAIKGERP